MKISIITLFPEMFDPILNTSILKRAQDKSKVNFELINLRDFGEGKHQVVDDRPYGGGAGMVLKAEILAKAVKLITKHNAAVQPYVILASASGTPYKQEKARELSKLDHLIIVCGHYEGVDQRFIDKFVDEEISMGDFVSTGGEITAAAITDATVRLIPNVLKKDEATQLESFFLVSMNQLINTVGENQILASLKKKGITKVKLLEYPQYTRPDDFMGKKVPEVLLSGNHKEIEKWRLTKAFEETLKKRPDLLV